MEDLSKITHTIENYPVKDLRFLPIDNIIVGLAKCPYANQQLRDGYISVQWKLNGSPLNKNKGREYLRLKL